MGSWIRLVTAFGAGGIIIKLLDIFLLQELTYKQNKKKWLREKKLNAYTNLLSIINTYGLHNIKLDEIKITEIKSISSEVMLLSNNEKLVSRIDEYLEYLQHIHNKLEEDLAEQDIDPEMITTAKKQELLKHIGKKVGLSTTVKLITRDLREEIHDL